MGKVLIKRIYIYLVEHIGVIAAKIMAIPAIKALLVKFVTAAIVASLVKLIVVKIGISVSTAVTIVLLPILGKLLAHEWKSFPANLGASIASSIRNELDKNFAKTNEESLSNIFQQLLEDQVQTLGKHLADDDEVAKSIDQILSLINNEKT